MPRSCQVPEKELLNPPIDRPQGFVLLEVLVAMSLILGSWMALVGTYQNLALRATHMESKRAQLRREFAAFEVSEQARVSTSINTKGQNHESSRVPSRHRAQHVTSQPTSKNQR
jgi:prepilin-type N-terminal cleavage/methylation domain-containing protein